MGLSSSLQIGRTGLLTQQAALQVTGNNLANLATPGYHRQDATIASTPSSRLSQGIYVGTGVELQAVTRQINEALEARLRTSLSNESGSQTTFELLNQIEAIQNEFSDVSLSTRLSEFFDGWSNAANNPQNTSLRTLAVQQSTGLTQYVNGLRQEYGIVEVQSDRAINNAVTNANDLLNRIGDLNAKIAVQSRGPGGAPALQDQRDALLNELAGYMDISTVKQPNGVADVFVGSTPIILSGSSRGVEFKTRIVNGETVVEIATRQEADGSQDIIDITGGELGALLTFRRDHLEGALNSLDTFANTLAFEVNKIHSTGQGLIGHAELTSQQLVADPTVGLNSEDAEIPFDLQHGSFQFHVTQKSTGQRIATNISVDLDGIGADTSLNDLAAQINAVSNVTAVVNPNGSISITSDAGDFEFSFSDDTSGVLAGLGINTLFTGSDAASLDVNETVVNNARLVNVGQGHLTGDNRNAIAIAQLRETGVNSLNGSSLTEYWSQQVEGLAIAAGTARSDFESDQIVRANLEAQQQSVSGVNADEETIDLIQFQSAYQASARFLSVVDEMLQTLLSIA